MSTISGEQPAPAKKFAGKAKRTTRRMPPKKPETTKIEQRPQPSDEPFDKAVQIPRNTSESSEKNEKLRIVSQDSPAQSAKPETPSEALDSAKDATQPDEADAAKINDIADRANDISDSADKLKQEVSGADAVPAPARNAASTPHDSKPKFAKSAPSANRKRLPKKKSSPVPAPEPEQPKQENREVSDPTPAPAAENASSSTPQAPKSTDIDTENAEELQCRDGEQDEPEQIEKEDVEAESHDGNAEDQHREQKENAQNRATKERNEDKAAPISGNDQTQTDPADEGDNAKDDDNEAKDNDKEFKDNNNNNPRNTVEEATPSTPSPTTNPNGAAQSLGERRADNLKDQSPASTSVQDIPSSPTNGATKAAGRVKDRVNQFNGAAKEGLKYTAGSSRRISPDGQNLDQAKSNISPTGKKGDNFLGNVVSKAEPLPKAAQDLGDTATDQAQNVTNQAGNAQGGEQTQASAAEPLQSVVNGAGEAVSDLTEKAQDLPENAAGTADTTTTDAVRAIASKLPQSSTADGNKYNGDGNALDGSQNKERNEVAKNPANGSHQVEIVRNGVNSGVQGGNDVQVNIQRGKDYMNITIRVPLFGN